MAFFLKLKLNYLSKMHGYPQFSFWVPRVQYSPKIMHAQEVAQEVLAPQEHASGQKKLNCGLSPRTFKAQEDRKLAARSYELNRKTQKAQEVSGFNRKSSRCCLSEVITDYVFQNINRFQKEGI